MAKEGDAPPPPATKGAPTAAAVATTTPVEDVVSKPASQPAQAPPAPQQHQAEPQQHQARAACARAHENPRSLSSAARSGNGRPLLPRTPPAPRAPPPAPPCTSAPLRCRAAPAAEAQP
jgi:hypothetical protein